MKIMTILGTRPEIIRLSLIIEKLDQYATEHILVHTGQNYDHSLSQVFFDEMGVRKPDYHIHLSSYSLGAQLGEMFAKVEEVMEYEKPDRLLVLGDTNSALCALLGERKGIPVYHMEAGNRCFNTEVPEEINRKVIDSISTYNLPYTHASRDNLIREGIPSQRIWVSGNPIYEVLSVHQDRINSSKVLTKLNLEPKGYMLVTMHRAENVDRRDRLSDIMEGLRRISNLYDLPVICSVHPRTKHKLEQYDIPVDGQNLIFCEPFGFYDFIQLQKHALCVITDSGTVQEESCILNVPSVTIRDSTERPETILCGSNVLSGTQSERIVECVNLMINKSDPWPLPEGYNDPNVSQKVTQMVLGGLYLV